jgi:hypothetical protein
MNKIITHLSGNDEPNLQPKIPFAGQFSGRKELDVRSLTQRGDTLAKAIQDEVGYSQSVLIQQLPNVLILTPEQYDDQKRFFRKSDLFGPVEMYMTNHNVMEIEVQEL